MILVRCVNRHFFSDKYSVCPTCKEPPVRTVGIKARSLKAEDKDKQNINNGITNVQNALNAEKDRKNFFNNPKMNEEVNQPISQNEAKEEKGTTVSVFVGNEATSKFTPNKPEFEKNIHNEVSKPVEETDVKINGENQSGVQGSIPKMRPISSGDIGKTVSFFNSAVSEPTVGWVVILSGSQRGMDFPIYSGKNAIYRRNDDEIVCSNANSDMAKAELMLIFDPKSKQFIVQCVSGKAFINEELIDNMIIINDRDKLLLGNVSMDIFFLCNSEFDWKVD